MTQIEIAKDFLQKIVAGQIDEAYEAYVAEDFVSHNAYFEGTRDALRDAMKEADQAQPHMTQTVKMQLEEAARVMIMSHIQNSPDDAGFATVHIFRFENGKIVELWDLAQQLPNVPVNSFGVF